MNKVIIGSTAMKHWFPDFRREPKDLDYAVPTKENLQSTKQVEYLENPVIFKYLEKDQEYVTADQLLTLKMSHLFWDINWDKHNFDVQFLLKKGCTYIPELFHELYDFWNVYHKKNKRSNLKLNSKDFFNNAIKCPVEHDTIHTFLNPVPVYTKILVDGAEVEVSEEKYNELTHQEKIDLVREEVYVMAYERLYGRDYRVGYAWMLKKFIREHAPMWEAIFIIHNFIELHKPVFNYAEFLDGKINEYLQYYYIGTHN